MSGDQAALALMMLLDGIMLPIQPAALRALFRCHIRAVIGSTVNAGPIDEAAGDECAAALYEGVSQ